MIKCITEFYNCGGMLVSYFLLVLHTDGTHASMWRDWWELFCTLILHQYRHHNTWEISENVPVQQPSVGLLVIPMLVNTIVIHSEERSSCSVHLIAAELVEIKSFKECVLFSW